MTLGVMIAVLVCGNEAATAVGVGGFWSWPNTFVAWQINVIIVAPVSRRSQSVIGVSLCGGANNYPSLKKAHAHLKNPRT